MNRSLPTGQGYGRASLSSRQKRCGVMKFEELWHVGLQFYAKYWGGSHNMCSGFVGNLTYMHITVGIL